jgi:hypothetical protein
MSVFMRPHVTQFVVWFHLQVGLWFVLPQATRTWARCTRPRSRPAWSHRMSRYYFAWRRSNTRFCSLITAYPSYVFRRRHLCLGRGQRQQPRGWPGRRAIAAVTYPRVRPVLACMGTWTWRTTVPTDAWPRPPCGRELASTRGHCVSIFLDKNRRYIGKSQSKRPPKRTQRTPHHLQRQAPTRVRAVEEADGLARSSAVQHPMSRREQPAARHDLQAAPHMHRQQGLLLLLPLRTLLRLRRHLEPLACGRRAHLQWDGS